MALMDEASSSTLALLDMYQEVTEATTIMMSRPTISNNLTKFLMEIRSYNHYAQLLMAALAIAELGRHLFILALISLVLLPVCRYYVALKNQVNQILNVPAQPPGFFP
ncbi:unnamed protein product, partial [Mesorhabditis spiculigera]